MLVNGKSFEPLPALNPPALRFRKTAISFHESSRSMLAGCIAAGLGTVEESFSTELI
jgi:hypothetical protein